MPASREINAHRGRHRYPALMTAASWLWIPITLWAALAQTLAAVGLRAATLQLTPVSFAMAAAQTLVVALSLQTLLLGGYLWLRRHAVVAGVVRTWRAAWFAGFMGAAASAGWFTAFALATAAQVRTLGLVELLFSYAIARRLFREPLGRLASVGIALPCAGLVLIMLRR
jgi:drug/metabolite transporter (DMT)-like permease